MVNYFFMLLKLSVLGLLLAAGCSTMDTTQSEGGGYGAFPEDPAKAIAQAVGSRQIVEITEPQPYYTREGDDWQFGWRVCTRFPGRELGYFLLRGDDVVTTAFSNSPRDGDAVRARQHCSGIAAGQRAQAKINETRTDVLGVR